MNGLFSTTPLHFLVQNLWRDEAYSVLLAQLDFLTITRLTAGDFSPPLYYYLLKVWMIFFGTTEIAVRSLSLSSYVILLVIVIKILHDIYKIPYRRTICYFFLFAGNPFLLTYAFEARMYMLGACLVTMSYFFIWKNNWKGYVISATLALYTHYFTILVISGQIVWKLYEVYKNHAFEHKYRFAREIAMMITPVIALIPWIMYMLILHQGSAADFWILRPVVREFFYIPFTLYTGYETVFGTYFHNSNQHIALHNVINPILIFIITMPVILAIWTGRNRYNRPKNKKDQTVHTLIKNSVMAQIILWAFGAPVLLFILSYVWQPLYLPRYFLFSSIGFLLLLTVCIELLFRRFSSWNIFSYMVFFISVLTFFHLTHRYNEINLRYRGKRNVQRLYEQIAAQLNKGDQVYVTDVLDYHLALYYLPRETTVNIYLKTYEETPQYVGKVLIPPSVFTAILPLFPHRAFVVYYNWFESRSLL